MQVHLNFLWTGVAANGSLGESTPDRVDDQSMLQRVMWGWYGTSVLRKRKVAYRTTLELPVNLVAITGVVSRYSRQACNDRLIIRLNNNAVDFFLVLIFKFGAKSVGTVIVLAHEFIDAVVADRV